MPLSFEEEIQDSTLVEEKKNELANDVFETVFVGIGKFSSISPLNL